MNFFSCSLINNDEIIIGFHFPSSRKTYFKDSGKGLRSTSRGLFAMDIVLSLHASSTSIAKT